MAKIINAPDAAAFVPALGATNVVAEKGKKKGFAAQTESLPLVSPGLARQVANKVIKKEGQLPLAAATMNNLPAATSAELTSLKDKLAAALSAPPGSAKRTAAMQELRTYAKALKAGYPGEGETEGAKEFAEYILQKAGFDWDILRLNKPGKAAALAGANTNVYTAPDGTQIGAIEQGFAKENMAPAQAASFFKDAFAKLQSKGVEFVIVEENHPGRMDEAKKKEDDTRTNYRVDNALYMARFGVRSADAIYGQITLNSGDDPVIHLALGILPTNPKTTSIPTDQYLAIVKGYFATFKIVRDEAHAQGIKPGDVVEQDPTYQAIKKSLVGKKEVALLDPRTDWKLSAKDTKRWQPAEA